MRTERPRVLYIASVGRSGSTLLELLLDAQPAIASMGELHLWPHEVSPAPREHELPCACGAAVDGCDFWRQMAKEVNPLEPGARLDLFRERHQGGKTLRPSRLWDFRAGWNSSAPSPAMLAYGQTTAAVAIAYRTICIRRDDAEPEWLVDSSKDPYRLAWLARSRVCSTFAYSTSFESPADS